MASIYYQSHICNYLGVGLSVVFLSYTESCCIILQGGQ